MPPASPTQSVYVHAGDGPIDMTIWPPSGFQTPPSAIEGDTVPSEPLYYFSGDTTDPLTTNGANVPDWGLYTGPVETVSAPDPSPAQTMSAPTGGEQPAPSAPTSEQPAQTEQAPPSQPDTPGAASSVGTGDAGGAQGAPETPQASEVTSEPPVADPAPTEATETALASSKPAVPAIPGVVDGVVYRPRTDNDVLSGSFCRVINGEHQGRYGVFVQTATVFVNDGWPATVTVRTRDDRDEYIIVNYADIRPAQPGGR